MFNSCTLVYRRQFYVLNERFLFDLLDLLHAAYLGLHPNRNLCMKLTHVSKTLNIYTRPTCIDLILHQCYNKLRCGATSTTPAPENNNSQIHDAFIHIHQLQNSRSDRKTIANPQPFDEQEEHTTHHGPPKPQPRHRDPRRLQQPVHQRAAAHDSLGHLDIPTLSNQFHKLVSYLHVLSSHKSYIVSADPSLTTLEEPYTDAIGRSIMISGLLLDEKPGMLANVVEMSYPGHNAGGQPPMSAAIIDAVKDLKKAATEKE